jgi:hypothetical protein
VPLRRNFRRCQVSGPVELGTLAAVARALSCVAIGGLAPVPAAPPRSAAVEWNHSSLGSGMRVGAR